MWAWTPQTPRKEGQILDYHPAKAAKRPRAPEHQWTWKMPAHCLTTGFCKLKMCLDICTTKHNIHWHDEAQKVYLSYCANKPQDVSRIVVINEQVLWMTYDPWKVQRWALGTADNTDAYCINTDIVTALWHFVKATYRKLSLLPPLVFPLSIPFPQSCSPASIEVKSSGTTITAASYCLQGAVYTKDRLHRQAGETEGAEAERVQCKRWYMTCRVKAARGDILFLWGRSCSDCNAEGKSVDRVLPTVM